MLHRHVHEAKFMHQHQLLSVIIGETLDGQIVSLDKATVNYVVRFD